MGPTDIVNTGFAIAGKTTFALDQALKTQTDIAPKFISLHIARFPPKGITAIGIVVAHYTQIQIIIDGKIISAILKEKAPTVIFPNGGNYKPRGPIFRQWKICKRQPNRGGHIGDIHIGEPGNNLLPWNKLSLTGIKEIFRIVDIF